MSAQHARKRRKKQPRRYLAQGKRTATHCAQHERRTKQLRGSHNKANAIQQRARRGDANRRTERPHPRQQSRHRWPALTMRSLVRDRRAVHCRACGSERAPSAGRTAASRQPSGRWRARAAQRAHRRTAAPHCQRPKCGRRWVGVRVSRAVRHSDRATHHSARWRPRMLPTASSIQAWQREKPCEMRSFRASGAQSDATPSTKGTACKRSSLMLAKAPQQP